MLVNYGVLSTDAHRIGALADSASIPSSLHSAETGTASDQAQETYPLVDEWQTQFSPKCTFEANEWDTGTASILNEILNLVKNIVGSGGLSLPAGIATFGNNPTAIIPAMLVIVLMGIVNAYSFSLLGRVASITKAKTYQEAWDRTMGRQHGTKYNIWVALVVTGKAILGCWSFSIVIASTCQPLLETLGFQATKTEALLGISLLVLLPLCSLERLSSLAFFSTIGQMGTLVTAFTMMLRYVDGTYRAGGTYYDVSLEKGLTRWNADFEL